MLSINGREYKSIYEGRLIALGRERVGRSKMDNDSFSILETILKVRETAPFEQLAIAVYGHPHPAGPAAFVRYCIHRGWLKVVGYSAPALKVVDA